jgi:hypothetical protein
VRQRFCGPAPCGGGGREGGPGLVITGRLAWLPEAAQAASEAAAAEARWAAGEPQSLESSESSDGRAAVAEGDHAGCARAGGPAQRSQRRRTRRSRAGLDLLQPRLAAGWHGLADEAGGCLQPWPHRRPLPRSTVAAAVQFGAAWSARQAVAPQPPAGQAGAGAPESEADTVEGGAAGAPAGSGRSPRGGDDAAGGGEPFSAGAAPELPAWAAHGLPQGQPWHRSPEWRRRAIASGEALRARLAAVAQSSTAAGSSAPDAPQLVSPWVAWALPQRAAGPHARPPPQAARHGGGAAPAAHEPRGASAAQSHGATAAAAPPGNGGGAHRGGVAAGQVDAQEGEGCLAALPPRVALLLRSALAAGLRPQAVARAAERFRALVPSGAAA